MKRKNEEMDIVFLLDRSGSMGGMESDTIGGYNSYLNQQKDKNALVTTVLFDDQYELLTNRAKIQDVSDLTSSEYYVRGCTALLDAIGKTIKLMDKAKSKKCIFVITTDGYENASKEYNKAQIKELIEGNLQLTKDNKAQQYELECLQLELQKAKNENEFYFKEKNTVENEYYNLNKEHNLLKHREAKLDRLTYGKLKKK